MNYDREGLALFAEDMAAVENDTDYFVTSKILAGTPRTWQSEIDYIKWRHQVSVSLGMDASSVYIIGSAKLGYSLNPEKKLKVFNEKASDQNVSDLDVAIVSELHFEECWKVMREIENTFTKADRGYGRRTVFQQCIPVDRLIPHLPFGELWGKSRDSIVRPLGERFQGLELNFRIYRNSSALRSYQLSGVRAIQTEVENLRLQGE
ncbi:hypothetical protein [Jonesia quinghaiensis]|uniref:hypothetical protein n=1 Tax=Jonesia quinghaiensis TaxID=262806 RepID=UPI00048B6DD8|nr:hypothetical protein [Jonesia quinghaiensis]